MSNKSTIVLCGRVMGYGGWWSVGGQLMARDMVAGRVEVPLECDDSHHSDVEGHWLFEAITMPLRTVRPRSRSRVGFRR